MTRRSLLIPFALSAAGLAALTMLPAARAESCGTAYHRHVVETPVVAVTPVISAVAPVEVAVYNPLAVQVPVYSAYYNGGQPQAPAQASLSPEAIELLRQLGARLDGIEAHLRGAGGLTPPAPLPPIPPLPPKPPVTPGAAGGPQAGAFSSCTRCHDGDAAKGGGHSLFAAGQPLPWTCDVMLEIQDRVTRDPSSKGAMPPDGGATDEQVAGMIAALKAQARLTAKK